MMECAWACNSGFYSQTALDASSSSCMPCTKYNATTCPAGYIFRSCSDSLSRDASCEEACPQGDKPLENSEWVLTTLNSNNQLIQNEGNMKLPNIGCMWKCSEGYKEQKLEMAGFSICVSAKF